jgi:hypothetical protein
MFGILIHVTDGLGNHEKKEKILKYKKYKNI